PYPGVVLPLLVMVAILGVAWILAAEDLARSASRHAASGWWAHHPGLRTAAEVLLRLASTLAGPHVLVADLLAALSGPSRRRPSLRRAVWTTRFVGAVLVAGAVGVAAVAFRQGFLLAGLVAGMVLIPALIGMAALLHLASRRWGTWAGLALIAALAGAI